MLDNLRGFSGSGFLFILLLASVLFLGFRLKKSAEKTATAWYPLYVLLIFFCPLWIIYLNRAEDGEILYRVLWMIPFAVIICFALVEAVFMMPEKYRVVSFLAAVAVIMISGKYIYSNPYFTKADNQYHVPQEVVDICDDIKVEGREVRACFPIEHIQYVRQYSPYVCLAYGRSVLLGGVYNDYSNVESYLNDETIDTKGFVAELRRIGTPYLVLARERKMTEQLESYGYNYVKSYGDYNLYLDETAYLGTDINYKSEEN